MGRWSIRVLVVGVVLAAALVGAVTAVAALSFTPTLGAPNHKQVHVGAISIKVRAPYSKTVYVQIEPHRKLRHGFLASCVQSGHGCDFTSLKRWKHHPGWWIFTAYPFTFPGWWSTTPGKYYWQAQSFAKVPPCQLVTDGDCIFNSKVGSFRVVG